MVRLGTSDLDVHPLILGGNTFGWTSSEADSHRVLDAFTGAGGSMVDTADGYSSWVPGHSGGESEEVIGAWLAARGHRDDVAITTKVSTHPRFTGLAPRTVQAGAEASLRRLRTDRIDLYYAHFDDPETPLEQTVRAFDALVTAGKVRYVGLSNYTPERIGEWLKTADGIGAARPVVLQPQYSLVHRGSYEGALQELALGEDLAVTPYFALAAGFLTGKYRTRADLEQSARSGLVGRYFSDAGLAVVDALAEIAAARGAELSTVALAWVLGRPGVSGVLASASRVEQLPALMAAADLRLTADEAAELTRRSSAVPA
ncbi:aldo/keto reductase [Nocardiopsis coralliicola]